MSGVGPFSSRTNSNSDTALTLASTPLRLPVDDRLPSPP
eukprot:CAMPEP_0119530502 /NCGR_PEP_ID=MMETSP1344-20130328/44347_1 /TAXON_ID=236787 /ORGANISM="Florenciella parvula, Strain CCMP2471" /LENGTH=38 /DNA_ID= /DNA_START= /DNA_END= /DNA_ORIENTATION=